VSGEQVSGGGQYPVTANGVEADICKTRAAACRNKRRTCRDTFKITHIARNRQLKSVKTEKLKVEKQICSEITVNILGNPCSES